MKRQANPHISSSGEAALAHYEQVLREQEDLTFASIRNYLSDVRQFIAWYEEGESKQRADSQKGAILTRKRLPPQHSPVIAHISKPFKDRSRPR